MNPPETPDRYRPSGRVDTSAFGLWAAVTVLASGALAVVLYLLYRVGFYFVGIVPLLMALGLSGMVFLVVSRGRCRNRTWAVLPGLVGGAFMYVGYYHVDMVTWLGVGRAHRVDLLPSFINLRMNTDVVGDPTLTGMEDDQEYEAPDPVKVAFNWVFFSLELGLCTLLPALAGWLRAERPFCEGCGKWMSQSLAHFDRSAAATIAEAVQQGRVCEVVNLPKVVPQARQPATILAVAHCEGPCPADGPRCPVYLSVKPVKDAAPPPINPHRTMRRALVRDRALSPLETTALVPLFPSLRPHADQAPVEETGVVSEPMSEAAGQDQQRGLHGVCILEEAIPTSLRGNVLATGSVIKSGLLACAPILTLLPVSAPLIFGVVLVVPLLDGQTDDPFPGVPAAVRWAVLIAGGVGLTLAGIWVYRHHTSWRDRYFQRRTRDALVRRPEVWVAPDDPDAYFVEVVPRENWQKLKAETATDFGFLKCDAEQAALYFEGDTRRICIPLETLTRVAVETITDASGMMSHCAVVVRASDNDQTFELPFLPYFPPWTSGRKASRHRAETLLLHMQETLPAPPDAPTEGAPGA
ncbi:MAG: hypothetical protein GY778_04870 [bacterium]|nr:hypothetical protein [bacterium]